MNRDIFTNLSCRSTVVPLQIMEIDGISWLTPAKSFTEQMYSIDLLSCSKQLLIDFFNLGELLCNTVKNYDYHPLDLEDKISFFSFQKKPIEECAPFFSDKQSPFLRDNSAEVSIAILEFFSKYGLSRKLCNDVIHVVICRLAEAVIPSAKGKPPRFWSYPISFLAYYIFELYMRYTDPEKYFNASKKFPTQCIKVVGSDAIPARLKLSINLTISYSEVAGWSEKKEINGIFDLIILLLFYNNDFLVKKCKYCGTIFITTLESAIYCSPSCRNRANSKKSYDRRKAQASNQSDN